MTFSNSLTHSLTFTPGLWYILSPMSAETLAPREQPSETVDRFITLTREPLVDEDSREYVHWQHEMDRLYGNPELAQLSRDQSLMGVEGIRKTLEDAFIRDGLNGLKVEFLKQSITHTRLGRFDSRILEVILNFQ